MTYFGTDFAYTSRNGLPSFTVVSGATGSDGFDISGAQTAITDNTTTNLALPATQPASGDQFIQATLANNAGTSTGIMVRATRLNPGTANDVGITGYLLRHSGTNVAIIRLDSSGSATLANASATRAAGDVLRLTVSGTVLNAYLNTFTTPFLTYDTASDTTKYSTGSVAMRVIGAATQPQVDNLYAGDMTDIGQVGTVTATGGGGSNPGTPTYVTNSSPANGIPQYKGIVPLPSGKWLYPGRPVTQLRATFFGADGAYTPPSWLTTSGTVAQQSDTGLSRLQLTTDATAGAKASIAVNPQIVTSGYRAIRLDVEGMSFAAQDPNAIWRMGAFNDSLGINNAIVQEDTGSTTGTLYAVTSSNVRTSGNYSVLGQFAMRRRPASVLLVPGAKEVYFMMDDRILLWRVGSTDWVDGLATLKLEIEAKAAAAQSLRLSSFAVTLYA